MQRLIDIGRNEATTVVGGGRPPSLERGYFVAPTLFDGLAPDSPLMQEEIFGPVLGILSFDSHEEAIAQANGVPYGLVAGVFTQDLQRALRAARDLHVGIVWINTWGLGGAHVPIGGTKQSGFGRDKGLTGLHNHLQVKNVAIHP